MAASTITRDTWTNDTGSAASPNLDGTVLNNSVLQNHIYARIDAMFAGSGAYTTFTFGGLIQSEAFGQQTFQAGGTGANSILLRNTTAGTGNYTVLKVYNDTSVGANLMAFASTYTTASANFASGVTLESTGSGGLSIHSSHASGAIRFYISTVQGLTLSSEGASMNPQARGTGNVGGTFLQTGRNTSGNGAAGFVGFLQRNGTANYVWADNSAATGVLRIHTGFPTEDNSTVADTAGTVVGSQASLKALKRILATFAPSDDAAALSLIQRTPIYRFQYRQGWQGQEFVGITTDDSPEFGYDRDAQHPQGKAFNPVNAFGYLVSAVKALVRRVEELEAR